MSKNRLACLAIAVIALVSGCGGGSDDDSGTTPASAYNVTIAAPDQLAAGPTRFVFALDDAAGRPVTNARAHLRFYFIDPNANNRETIKNEVEAQMVDLERSYTLTLGSGSEQTYGPGGTGVFANDVAFDQPGEWIVEITGSAGSGNLGVIRLPITVNDTLPGPPAGQPAPASNPEIAETVSSGQASLILFAREGKCAAEVCGPLAEVALESAAGHPGDVAVLSVDPEGDAAAEWGVDHAAVVFFIDADGIVRGRLHTIASIEEVDRLIEMLSE
jgi:hypothetical protein